MGILKEARIQFVKLKEKIPELSGMSFFGSRTLGKEKPESDLDCVLFISNKQSEINTSQKLEIAGTVGKELNLYNEDRNPLVIYDIMGVVDISPKATDDDIMHFRNIEKEQKRVGVNFTGANSFMPPEYATRLLTRFFLGIGEGLYENRKYILEKLAGQEDGELLWQKIIEYLSLFERGMGKRTPLTPYEHYPKTIAEARQYFITQIP